MSIITSSDSDYSSRRDGIRYFVNSSYTADDLPDAVIENDVYLPHANREILRRLPGYASLSTDQKLEAKVLVQELTAANILRSHLQELRESTGNQMTGSVGLAMEKQIAQLLAHVEAGIDILSPASGSDTTEAAGTISVVEIKGTF